MLPRVRRRLLVLVAVAAFVAVSAVVARWLQAENVERTKIRQLLERRTGGPVEIVRLDSETSHALGPRTGPTRVVWRRPGQLPVVQCVLVRRGGNALSGPSVTLLRISDPIPRLAGC